jgi:hypothetical protein
MARSRPARRCPNRPAARRSPAAAARRASRVRSASSLSTTRMRRRAPRHSPRSARTHRRRGRPAGALHSGRNRRMRNSVPAAPAGWTPSSRRPSGRSASWRWSGPGRCRRWRWARAAGGRGAREGLEDARRARRRDARAGVFDLEDAPSRALAGAKAHSPARVNLTALPSRLMRIWRSRFSSAAPAAGSVAVVVLEAKRSPCQRLQLEHLHDLLQAVAQAHRPQVRA